LNKTNFLQLQDIWIENNGKVEKESEEILSLYMQMELYDKTLEEFIKELQNNSNLFRNKMLTHLDYYIACHIFVVILKGVNYLHTGKPQILHMDLHSGNILLKIRLIRNDIRLNIEEKNIIEVKLADFGLAKICEFAQKSQTIT
jgi:serine/threonine protein kinase